MNRMGTFGVAAAAAGILVAAPAQAGSVQTEIVDFFSESEGPVASMLIFIRPHLTGRQIVETRLHVEFTPARGFDAGDLYFLLIAPSLTDPGSEGFVFLDARQDMGWSGDQTQTFDFTSDQLNGILQPGVWTFDLFPTIDPPIVIGAFSENSRWEVDTIPAPSGAALLAISGAALLRRRR